MSSSVCMLCVRVCVCVCECNGERAVLISFGLTGTEKRNLPETYKWYFHTLHRARNDVSVCLLVCVCVCLCVCVCVLCVQIGSSASESANIGFLPVCVCVKREGQINQYPIVDPSPLTFHCSPLTQNHHPPT